MVVLMTTVHSTVLGRDVDIIPNPNSSSPYDVGKININKVEGILLSLHGGQLGNGMQVIIPNAIYLHA